MNATHRSCPRYDSFEVVRSPDWYSETPEVVISSLTYTVALSNFQKLNNRESIVELFGIDGDKPPKLLKTNKRGASK